MKDVNIVKNNLVCLSSEQQSIIKKEFWLIIGAVKLRNRINNYSDISLLNLDNIFDDINDFVLDNSIYGIKGWRILFLEVLNNYILELVNSWLFSRWFYLRLLLSWKENYFDFWRKIKSWDIKPEDIISSDEFISIYHKKELNENFFYKFLDYSYDVKYWFFDEDYYFDS